MIDLIDRKHLIKNLNRFAPEHYSALINSLIMKEPKVDAVPIDWIEEWCLSQDLEYVRIAIKKMMDNWNGERKEE